MLNRPLHCLKLTTQALMSWMFTTRALLWGVRILYRLIIYSFIQVVALEFSLFHTRTQHWPLCIIFKTRLRNLSREQREYPTAEECSFHLPLILHDVILAVYGRAGRGGARCQLLSRERSGMAERFAHRTCRSLTVNEACCLGFHYQPAASRAGLSKSHAS